MAFHEPPAVILPS